MSAKQAIDQTNNTAAVTSNTPVTDMSRHPDISAFILSRVADAGRR